MRLSEAILKGAESTLPLKQALFQGIENDCVTHACVLGCAWMAYAWDHGTALDTLDIKTAPVLRRMASTWPEIYEGFFNPTSGKRETLCTILIRLNDEEDWTREQIAAWVEKEGL